MTEGPIRWRGNTRMDGSVLGDEAHLYRVRIVPRRGMIAYAVVYNTPELVGVTPRELRGYVGPNGRISRIPVAYETPEYARAAAQLHAKNTGNAAKVHELHDYLDEIGQWSEGEPATPRVVAILTHMELSVSATDRGFDRKFWAGELFDEVERTSGNDPDITRHIDFLITP